MAGKASPLCQSISCPTWAQLSGSKVPKGWHCLLAAVPVSWQCCQSSRVCMDPSVGTEQAFSAWFAIKEHSSPLQMVSCPLCLVSVWESSAGCLCGWEPFSQNRYCASRSAGSASFCLFFFSQGLFRVWICYCQSLKAGTPNKGWPLVGSP